VRRSAQQGYASAQFELGSAYASGTGVLQDYVEAHKWLNLAAARLEGEERNKAAAMRDQVASRMTPDQVAQAQQGAREWMEAFQRR
jgi:TPR repeat protein